MSVFLFRGAKAGDSSDGVDGVNPTRLGFFSRTPIFWNLLWQKKVTAWRPTLILSFESWWQRFNEHDPAAAMIIQGHFLLEEQLNVFIAKAFRNPKEIDDLNLKFYTKLHIVKAFQPTDQRPDLWELFDLLSKLWNLDGSSTYR
jgi:hypothetical protein